MLESFQGLLALVQVGMMTLGNLRSSHKKRIVFQSNGTKESLAMEEFVSKVPRKVRAEPPTMIVSDRVLGEGDTQRTDWVNALDKDADPESNFSMRSLADHSPEQNCEQALQGSEPA